MHFNPRQLLTSGTAMAAVAGALLLSVEDGKGSYARAQVLGVDMDPGSWFVPAPAPSPLPRRLTTDARSSAPR